MVVHKVDDGFEQLNSGCGDEEPEEAGPGMMGHMLITFSHVKERMAAAHFPHSPRSGSSPKTPSGVETSEHESNVEDLKDNTHSFESKVGENPQDNLPSDQQHHDAVGLDYVGGGGQIGDIASSAGSSRSSKSDTPSTGSGRSFWEGTPESPKMPLGERIMGKLPGSHTNPYAVGSPTRPHAVGSPTRPHGVGSPTRPYATSPYSVGDHSVVSMNHSIVSTSPSIQRSIPLSPSIFGRMEFVTKLADKLHLRKKSSSPRAVTEIPGTPTPNSSTGLPSPTTRARSTNIGTATGPTED